MFCERFSDKVVMVTGAGRNMGKAIALAFAGEGGKIAVCDLNLVDAEATAAEIRASGKSAEAFSFDLRNKDEILRAVADIEKKLGSVDVLVNNAGGSAGLLGKLTRFVDAEQETLDFVLDLNLRGTMMCIQAVLKPMIEKKYGRIVSISSIAGVCGIADRVDYSAAKAGIAGMTKALALEVGKYNICVNAVAPGMIERNRGKCPGSTVIGEDGRAGTVEELADFVVSVASNAYLTGQEYIIDGGRTLGPKGIGVHV